MITDVSEERITSIFGAEIQPRKKHLLHSGFLLGWFWTLKMEVVRFSETSLHIRTTQRCIPVVGNIRNCRCEKLKSFIIITLIFSPPYSFPQQVNHNDISFACLWLVFSPRVCNEYTPYLLILIISSPKSLHFRRMTKDSLIVGIISPRLAH
jgi:hypothetical protein